MTSARSASALSARNWANEREPASSSPSMNSATPRSKSSPSASVRARSAAMCAMTPALSSAAPRPYRRPPRTVGSNGGGLPQRLVADRLHVVVGVEQDRRAAVARRARREHRGLAELVRAGDRGAADLDGLEEAESLDEGGDGLGAALHLARRRSRETRSTGCARGRRDRRGRRGCRMAAASRTASCRVRLSGHAGNLKVLPLSRHRGSTVAKTPAAPVPADVPAETTTPAARAARRRPAPSRRPRASARSSPTRRRRKARAQGRARRAAREGPRRHGRRRGHVPPGRATRVRSASSCATSSTPAGTSARPSCPRWCS